MDSWSNALFGAPTKYIFDLLKNDQLGLIGKGADPFPAVFGHVSASIAVLIETLRGVVAVSDIPKFACYRIA